MTSSHWIAPCSTHPPICCETYVLGCIPPLLHFHVEADNCSVHQTSVCDIAKPQKWTRQAVCVYHNMRCIHITLVTVKKQEFVNIMNVCLSSCLIYLAWKLHLFFAVLCCHLWPVWPYHIFPRLMNGTIFKKKLLSRKCVCLDFLYNFCQTLFSFQAEVNKILTQIYVGLNVKYTFLSDINQTCIFPEDFKKILKYQISWQSVHLEPSCSMWTDRHDDSNSSSLQFCECA